MIVYWNFQIIYEKNSKTGTFEATILDPGAQNMSNFSSKNHRKPISYLLKETSQNNIFEAAYTL